MEAARVPPEFGCDLLGADAAQFAVLAVFDAGGSRARSQPNASNTKSPRAAASPAAEDGETQLAKAIALGRSGRTFEAEALFGEIAESAVRRESVVLYTTARGQRGLERLRRGALEEALEDLRAALDVARGQPWETFVDDGRAHLLTAEVERGRPDVAERELLTWCATADLPDTTFGNRLLVERGRLRLAEARFPEAIADLDLAARRLASGGDAAEFEWRGAAALAHHCSGDQRKALTLATEDLAAASGEGARRQLGIATGTLGVIQGGREGLSRLRAAVEILEPSPARLELARAHVNLGSALRRGGEPRRARSHLRAGLEIAVSCGAMSLAHLAEQELAATGIVRRRSVSLSGPDALTPTERRVANLAAEGLSNPEIAGALSVTRKTVEMHLGGAYRKLEINSRRELASALSGHSVAVRLATV